MFHSKPGESPSESGRKKIEKIKKVVGENVTDDETLKKIADSLRATDSLDSNRLMQMIRSVEQKKHLDENNPDKQYEKKENQSSLEVSRSVDEEEMSDLRDAKKTFEFTEEDLYTNRQGYLTPRQQRILAKTKQSLQNRTCCSSCALLTPLLLIVIASLIGTSDFHWNDPGFQESLPYIGITFGIYILFVTIPMLWGYMAWRDMRTAHVSVAEGIAKMPKNEYYTVIIGGTRFMTPLQYEKFREGRRYKIYYIKGLRHSHLILSFEELKIDSK